MLRHRIILTYEAEVEPVIKEALATKNVVIMDFSIAREEGVFPMVPAGKAINEMLLKPKEEKTENKRLRAVK